MKKALLMMTTFCLLSGSYSVTALAEEEYIAVQESSADAESVPAVGISDTYRPYADAKYDLTYEVRYYQNGTQSIPRVVITGCKNYKSKDDLGALVIPAQINNIPVYRIDDYAFHECKGFTGRLTLPEGVAEIGESAFSGCSGFTGILRLPQSLKKIEPGAFYDCKGLQGDLTIPSGVEKIGKCAFLQCESLSKHIYVKGNPTIDNQEDPNVVSAFERANTKKSEITIHAVKGSFAESYARENGYLYSDNMFSTTVVFDDIKATDWWLDAVQYVYDNEIMSGMGNSFRPAEPLTREQFVQVLYSNEGKPAVDSTNPFTDVKQDWYTNAVLWANKSGVAAGVGNGIFGVGFNITREQLVQMLYQYAKLKGFDMTATKDKYTSFADAGKVSDWARDAVDWAVTQGVITGKGGNLFDPQGNATRAECATMIRKLLSK